MFGGKSKLNNLIIKRKYPRLMTINNFINISLIKPTLLARNVYNDPFIFFTKFNPTQINSLKRIPRQVL